MSCPKCGGELEVVTLYWCSKCQQSYLESMLNYECGYCGEVFKEEAFYDPEEHECVREGVNYFDTLICPECWIKVEEKEYYVCTNCGYKKEGEI